MTYTLKIYMKSGAVIELDQVESCDINFTSETQDQSQYTNPTYTAYSPPGWRFSGGTRVISNFLQSGSARNLIELETLDLNEVVAIVRVY